MTFLKLQVWCSKISEVDSTIPGDTVSDQDDWNNNNNNNSSNTNTDNNTTTTNRVNVLHGAGKVL